MPEMPQRHCLALDGFVLNKRVLEVVTELEQLIDAVACISDMRILNFTASFIDEDLRKLNVENFQDEGGISVQALISTSHIAIHGWPNRSLFMFDLVSCKAFDFMKVASYLIFALNVYKINHCRVVQNGAYNSEVTDKIYTDESLRTNEITYGTRLIIKHD